MITDVAVDIDGVLFDFATTVQKHFSEYFQTAFPKPTTWEFYEHWNLSAKQFYDTLDLLTDERDLFNDSAPLPKTMVGWQALREQGLRIHIITHRSPTAYAQTIKWLERYRLIPDTLHFSGQKADIINALAVDECASIDDHVFQYNEYRDSGVHGYLYTQPWNDQYAGRRVNTLPEFANIIKTHNEYWKMEHDNTLMEIGNGVR